LEREYDGRHGGCGGRQNEDERREVEPSGGEDECGEVELAGGQVGCWWAGRVLGAVWEKG
jgi:hypothetical protein